MARSLELIFDPKVQNVSEVQRLEAAIDSIRKNTRLSSDEFGLLKERLVEAVRAGQSVADTLKDIASGPKNSNVTQAAKELVDNFKKLQDEAKKARKELEEFAANVRNAIEHPLRFAGQQVEQLVLSVGKVGVIAAGAATGLAIVGREAFNLVSSFADGAREATNLAARLGVSASQARSLQTEATIAGVNVRSLEFSSHLLAAGLEDSYGAGRRVAQALHSMGIETRTATGAVRDTGPVLLEVIDKLSRMNSQAQMSFEAYRLLGRGSKEIIPLVERHRELTETMERYGLSLNDNVIKKGRDASVQIETMKASIKQLRDEAAIAIAPIVIRIVRVTTDLVNDARNGGPYIEGVGRPLNLGEASGGFTDLSAPYIDPTRLSPNELHGVVRLPSAQSAVDFMAKDARDRRGSAFAARYNQTKQGLENELRGLQQDQNLLLPGAMAGNANDIDQFNQNDARIKKIQAQIDALKNASKEAAELRALLEHFGNTDVSPIERIINTYKADITKLTSPADREAVRVAANNAINREIEKERLAGAKRQADEQLRMFEAQQRVDEAFAKEALEGDKLKNIPSFITAGMQNVPGPPGPSYRQQTQALQQFGQFQTRATELTRTPGVAGGFDALQKELQIRKEIALLELQGDLEKASEHKTAIERVAAEFDAWFSYEQKKTQIRRENELYILELRKQEKDEFRNLAVGFVNAAQSGSLPSFFRSQAQKLESTVVGNVAGMAFPSIAKHIPDLAGNSPLLNRLLAGTPFAGNAFQDTTMKAATDTAVYTKATATGVAALYQAITGQSLPGSTALTAAGFPSIPGFGGGGGILSIPGLTTNGGAFESGGFSVGGTISSINRIAGLLKPISGVSSSNGDDLLPGLIGVTKGQLSSTKENPFHALFNSDDSTSSRIGAGVGIAGAGFGAFTGISQAAKGGARNIIGGIGTTLASIAPLTGPAAPFLLAAGLGANLISSFFGDPKAIRQRDINRRLAADQFYEPVAINATMGTDGSAVSTDRYGNVQSNDTSPFPVVQEPYADLRNGITVPGRTLNPIGGPSGVNPGPTSSSPTTINIHTWDSQSMDDFLKAHSDRLAGAVALGMNNGGSGGEHLANSIAQRG